MIRMRSLTADTFAALLAGAIVTAGTMTAANAPQKSSAHSAKHPHWGYEGAVSPAAWCGLEPANNACCNGKEQSPIDIETATVAAGTPAKLEVSYVPSTFKVLNNGHTVQADVQAGTAKCRLMLGGTPYELLQFHVHTPSEHQIDGKHSPLEMHFVHKSAAGNLAVIGVLVEPGAANAELEKIWSLAPAHEGPGGTAAGVDLLKVLPASRVNFRYPGSLTTPPCSEHVQWIVMQAKITMSEAQITKLQGLFGGPAFPEGNSRPVQPLGARKVELDSGA